MGHANLVLGCVLRRDNLVAFSELEDLTPRRLAIYLKENTTRLSVEWHSRQYLHEETNLRTGVSPIEREPMEEDYLNRYSLLVGTCLGEVRNHDEITNVGRLPKLAEEREELTTLVLDELKQAFPKREWSPRDLSVYLVSGMYPRDISALSGARKDYSISGLR